MSKLIVLASLTTFFFDFFGVSWDSVDRKITREFPAVQFVEGDQLLERLQGEQGSVPILIDVREAEEFAVSHVAGAVNLPSAASIASQFPDRDAPVIVYCSVGYRSAGVAQQLQDMGYSRVRNLRHSLFEWANRGYPMVNAGGPTDKVHPFNRAWGALVTESYRAWSPENP